MITVDILTGLVAQPPAMQGMVAGITCLQPRSAVAACSGGDDMTLLCPKMRKHAAYTNHSWHITGT